jgi:hypothetical protein
MGYAKSNVSLIFFPFMRRTKRAIIPTNGANKLSNR